MNHKIKGHDGETSKFVVFTQVTVVSILLIIFFLVLYFIPEEPVQLDRIAPESIEKTKLTTLSKTFLNNEII